MHFSFCGSCEPACSLPASHSTARAPARPCVLPAPPMMRAPDWSARSTFCHANDRTTHTTSLPLSHMRVCQRALIFKTKKRTTFFSGCIFLHGIFNGDRDLPCCGSGLHTVRCRGSAQRLLHFSE